VVMERQQSIKPLMDGERQHLLIQENAPPDMTGYVLCAACVFFLANPLFGALAFILAGKSTRLSTHGNANRNPNRNRKCYGVL